MIFNFAVKTQLELHLNNLAMDRHSNKRRRLVFLPAFRGETWYTYNFVEIRYSCRPHHTEHSTAAIGLLNLVGR